jgi:hypothetical protein
MKADRWDTPHSSNIASAEYDPEAQQLTVHFKSGGTYVHDGVSETAAEDFKLDPSPGGHYYRHIRGRYGVKKR